MKDWNGGRRIVIARYGRFGAAARLFLGMSLSIAFMAVPFLLAGFLEDRRGPTGLVAGLICGSMGLVITSLQAFQIVKFRRQTIFLQDAVFTFVGYWPKRVASKDLLSVEPAKRDSKNLRLKIVGESDRLVYAAFYDRSGLEMTADIRALAGLPPYVVPVDDDLA